MHGLIADAILAGRAALLDTLRAANAPRATFRTLLAFDLIVEADGTPLLMEINPFPGMTPQSEWHGAYLKRLLDDYVGACVDCPSASSHRVHADAAGREPHATPSLEGDGRCGPEPGAARAAPGVGSWALLLGGSRTGDAEGAVAAFGVVPCGSMLVRDRTVTT